MTRSYSRAFRKRDGAKNKKGGLPKRKNTAQLEKSRKHKNEESEIELLFGHRSPYIREQRRKEQKIKKLIEDQLHHASDYSWWRDYALVATPSLILWLTLTQQFTLVMGAAILSYFLELFYFVTRPWFQKPFGLMRIYLGNVVSMQMFNLQLFAWTVSLLTEINYLERPLMTLMYLLLSSIIIFVTASHKEQQFILWSWSQIFRKILNYCSMLFVFFFIIYGTLMRQQQSYQVLT